MDIPKEFRRLGWLFHQNVDREVDMSDEQAIIAYVLEGRDAADRAALKEALTKLLLRKSLTDGQLNRLWQSTGADWYISPLRRFLAAIRDAIPD